MMPVVTVVCLCYNHEHFLAEALDSVLAQTYPSIEIIVVDDMSTDSSRKIVEAYCQRYPQIKYINTDKNMGNCAAFNIGWRASSGDFVIDFATDDVLLPDRVEKQVAAFSALDKTYGVVYSDAQYIDNFSNVIGYHYKRAKGGQLLSFAPSGDIFEHLLGRYFICPPTMMMRSSVLEDLNGYDETLTYEDFDFWVRSSRRYKYFYLDEVTTKRRIHPSSLSNSFYKAGSRLLASTVKVCYKAAELVQTSGEHNALANRLKYEARHAYLTNHYREAQHLLRLLHKVANLPPGYQLLATLAKYKINLSFFRTLYYKLKYRH